MFEHKKQLLHEVKVERPNPQYAVLMQEQLGGGNGELKAAMQYISQSFRIKDPEIKDLFLEDLFLEEKANMATLSFMNMWNGLLVTLIYGGCERFDLKFKASWKVYWAGLNKE